MPDSTDEGPESASDPRLAPAVCAQWRQGDLFEFKRGIAIGPTGEIDEVTHDRGVVVISQSCDVVLPHRLQVQVAPLVTLDDKDAPDARLERRPQYVPMPHVEPEGFVDLDQITTVDKAALVGCKRTPAPPEGLPVRKFGTAVGRKFGRFALPDEVDASLKKLQQLVQSKAPKEQSPLGKVLANVAELRVRSDNDWVGPTYEIVLIFVPEPGVIPEFANDELPAPPSSLMGSAFDDDMNPLLSVSQVAERLLLPAASAEERYWLWEALGLAAAASCVEEAKRLGHEEAIVSVTHEVVPADKFPLTLVRRSEILDLDHLSPPRPFGA